jgi:RNA polymerase sigma factor (sigma-70 family)
MSVTAEFDWTVAGDAELAGAAAAGDRAAFAGIYDRYANRLYDFCIGMVGPRDAADCVQEAFCMAAVDLPTLRNHDKLRPWLYTIARHQALRTLRARNRETASDELPDEPSVEAGPDVLAARNELAELVAQAEDGISQRDRQVLELAYRHGLTAAEIAETLGVSAASAKKMVQRLRDTVQQSLGALLVARQSISGHNRCPELAAILANWDGQFTILLRKRISRHIESCASCDQDRGRLVNPASLLGTAAVFIPAPDWLRNQTLSQIPPTSGVAGATAAGSGAHALGDIVPRLPALTGRLAVVATAVIAVPAVAVAVAVTVGLPALRDEPTTSVTVSSAAPAIAPSQQRNAPASDPNIVAPAPNTSVLPSAGVTNPNIREPNSQGNPSIQTPPPQRSATVTQSEPAPTPTGHATPASLTPVPNRSAQPNQGAPQRPVKQCANGQPGDGGGSCPTPSAPAMPNCPHVAVPGPICAQTQPNRRDH